MKKTGTNVSGKFRIAVIVISILGSLVVVVTISILEMFTVGKPTLTAVSLIILLTPQCCTRAEVLVALCL